MNYPQKVPDAPYFPNKKSIENLIFKINYQIPNLFKPKSDNPHPQVTTLTLPENKHKKAKKASLNIKTHFMIVNTLKKAKKKV